MKNKFSIALSLAVVFALLVTSLALADTVTSDGDVLLPGPNINVTSCTTQSTFNGNAKIAYQGGTHFASAGGSLNISYSADSPVVASGPNNKTLPSGWDSNGDTFTFDGITTTVPAGTANGTYKVTVTVSGPKQGGGTYTIDNFFNVTVNCPTNTAPTVSVTGVTSGASYEYGTVPAAVCSVVDAEDGNSSFAASLSAITGPLSSYGLGSQTASCSYTDAGGLSASASATYSIVDITLPQVSCGSADGLWHAADVSIPCTASDNVALANPADASFSLSTNVPAGTEDSNASTNSYDVYDVAGNVATAGPISGNMIDKKAPTNINFVGGGIIDGGSYYFGFVPAGPTSCTADDGGSGLASCNVTGGGTTVGAHSFTATATDNVGNPDTATMSYTVLAWTLNGFYQPVDMNGVFNVVKGGSTVPLKFEVFAGATELTDISVIKSFVQTKVACDGSAPTDNIELTTTGGTTLRYDIFGGQFIQNWQTPKLPGQCYKVTMTTQDGSALFAFFRLK